MKKKLMYCLGICYFIFSMSGLAIAGNYLPDPDEPVSPINGSGWEYEFSFECLDPPLKNYGYVPHGVYELQGGTLFLKHTNGNFNLESQSIGVYIDDVYFGSLYTDVSPYTDVCGDPVAGDPSTMRGIHLDWHQLNSIVSDGVATVRVINSDYICGKTTDDGTGEWIVDDNFPSLSCSDAGSMEAWLVYDGTGDIICGEESESVAVDIKPTSCPNPINMKRKTGVLPVAVLGTDMLDITQIDPATIKLEGVAPLRWSVEDVSAPYTGDMEVCDIAACNELGPDGYADLTLKFKYAEIVAALGDVSNGCLMLKLTGNLIDGTPFAGKDVVRIKKKKNKKNKKKSKCNCDCDN